MVFLVRRLATVLGATGPSTVLSDNPGQAFLQSGFKKGDDRIMVVSPGVTQRRAAPAIHRAEVDPVSDGGPGVAGSVELYSLLNRLGSLLVDGNRPAAGVAAW